MVLLCRESHALITTSLSAIREFSNEQDRKFVASFLRRSFRFGIGGNGPGTDGTQAGTASTTTCRCASARGRAECAATDGAIETAERFVNSAAPRCGRDGTDTRR